MPAVLAVIVVLLLGLAPFDFFGADPQPAGEFFAARADSLSLPDIVSNIALYAVLGAVLHVGMSRHFGCRTTALSAAIVVGGLLSGAVEWLQGYSPTRVSSLLDWSSNVIGTSLGAALSWTCRGLLRSLLAAASWEFRDQPNGFVLKAYCLSLVVVTALPFWFSFDAGTVAKRVRDGQWVPFEADRLDAEAGNATAESDRTEASRTLYRRMDRWGRCGVGFVSFAVLGLLGYSSFRQQGFSAWAAVCMNTWLGGTLALGLCIIQIFAVAHPIESTPFLFRVVGLLSGLFVGLLLYDRSRFAERVDGAIDLRTLAKFGSAAALAYVLYAGLIPFTFDRGLDSIGEVLTSRAMLPFASYAAAQFAPAMDDLSTKLAAYAVFAGLLVACRPQLRHGMAVSVIALAVSVFIECTQAFMRVRVCGLTDPIVAVAGCLSGLWLYEQAASFVQFTALSEQAVRPPSLERIGHPSQAPVFGELLSAEEALASLADPSPQAPKEPDTSVPRIPNG